jgi:hypothetical protein
LEKPENQDTFRCPENIQRVREWRKAHPGYWRRKPRGSGEALQDLLIEKPLENPSVAPLLPALALQDVLSVQHAVLVGLIAQFTGTALQDHIALTLQRLQQLGLDILNGPTPSKGENHDSEKPHPPAAHPQGSNPVQLGGSPSGP